MPPMCFKCFVAAGFRRHPFGGNDVDEPFYSVAQARTDLGGIGHSKFYEMVAQGDLELVKLGGRSLVTGRSMRRLKERLLEQLAA